MTDRFYPLQVLQRWPTGLCLIFDGNMKLLTVQPLLYSLALLVVQEISEDSREEITFS